MENKVVYTQLNKKRKQNTANKRNLISKVVIVKNVEMAEKLDLGNNIMIDRLTPLQVFISCFSISALGGFFVYLRSDRIFEIRYAIAVTFYTGIVGLVIGLLWFTWCPADNMYFLIGVSGLAGLGGSTVIDMLIRVAKAGGIVINFRADEDKES